MGRQDTGVEAGEIIVCWDIIHDFSNHVQSYVDGTDFISISENLDIFLAGEIECTAACDNIHHITLKPSWKIAHDVIIQSDV